MNYISLNAMVTFASWPELQFDVMDPAYRHSLQTRITQKECGPIMLGMACAGVCVSGHSKARTDLRQDEIQVTHLAFKAVNKAFIKWPYKKNMLWL